MSHVKPFYFQKRLSVFFLTSLIVGLLTTAFFFREKSIFEKKDLKEEEISFVREQIRNQLGLDFHKEGALSHIKIKDQIGNEKNLSIQYSFDPDLQSRAQKLLNRYKPDYAAIVAIDATTGKILALADYQREDWAENLAVKATYPAASIFKIIPASAALDKKGLDTDMTIPINGADHTLYRRNVMSSNVNRWTRLISLKQAFARSVNSFFAKLAFKKLEPSDIEEYAESYFFNRPIETDFPIETSVATIPEEKDYALAEVASGFNRRTKLSPVQGAMMAAAIADDGIMRMPYVVEELLNNEGQVVFHSKPIEISKPISKLGAEKLRVLMKATVTQGTGRRFFKNFLKNSKFEDIEVGGKTGSLTGTDPKGKVDWFIGYAMNGNKKIAISTITVNKKFWTVKSAYLAQDLFKDYFIKPNLASR